MTSVVIAKTAQPGGAADLAQRFAAVRAQTESICAPLEIEDYVIQPVIDVSPPRWHLAHTTWFYENFLLGETKPDYKPFHPMFHYLFNSYYVQSGVFHPRLSRGDLTRPTVREIYEYRAHVTEAVHDLLQSANADELARLEPIVTLGMHHEQQHQELLVTDIKYILSCNPLEPVYEAREDAASVSNATAAPLRWLDFAGGIYDIGFDGRGDFCFDNELPRHTELLRDYRIASRPVTNGEYLAFVEDRGYERPELWLSDGWDTVRSKEWTAPLYWFKRDGTWVNFTLAGTRPVDMSEPVCHVSHYEADAYARWAGKRLPTEFEWEHAAAPQPGPAQTQGNFLESNRLHPAPLTKDEPHFYGDVWQWTQSAYLPYPGFTPLPGTVGEYNGKFMSGQIVLRGGSCATPQSHIRASYRNFFQPMHRWQFMGFRLAS